MASPVTAVYDANVLYSAPLRDLLLRLAQAGLVRARWTERIHDEWVRNVLANNPALSPARLARTRALINDAVRDCLVIGYEQRIEALSLPDPSDRHVLAAAIQAKADVIVTFNLKDFPAAILAAYHLAAVHPDDFVGPCLMPDLDRSVRSSEVSGRHSFIRREQPPNCWPPWKARGWSKQSPDSGPWPIGCDFGRSPQVGRTLGIDHRWKAGIPSQRPGNLAGRRG